MCESGRSATAAAFPRLPGAKPAFLPPAAGFPLHTYFLPDIRTAPAPPLRPVFPSFPASPLQNVVAIPSLPPYLPQCVVSVLEMGRDCCFSGVLSGVGAGDGTRLLFFPGFERCRCRRGDETVAIVLSAFRIWLAPDSVGGRWRWLERAQAGGGVGRWQKEKFGTGAGRRQVEKVGTGSGWRWWLAGGRWRRSERDQDGGGELAEMAEGWPVAGGGGAKKEAGIRGAGLKCV